MKTAEEFIKSKRIGIPSSPLGYTSIDGEKHLLFDLMESFAKERAVEFAESTWNLDGDYYTEKDLPELYDEFIKQNAAPH